jgi:hypothetical protein
MKFHYASHAMLALVLFGTGCAATPGPRVTAATADAPRSAPAPDAAAAPRDAATPPVAVGAFPTIDPPLPLPTGWVTRCEREHNCAPLREGFAGLTIANACGPLMPPRDVPAPYRSEMPLRAQHDAPISGAQCTVTQMTGELCSVICAAPTNPPWSAADALVQWIADRYGHYTRRTDSGTMRTWSWSQHDNEERLEMVRYDPANPFLRVTASVGSGRALLQLEYAVHFERATLRPRAPR